MKSEQVHTLILGAGPSGLAAAYTLAKAGVKPVLLERDKVAGGLMRSIRHGDFIVDIGRKELYNRLDKVDSFWKELLGADYRNYTNRGGILYDGHIIDMSAAYRGFMRGMPLSLFLGCGLDLLWWRLRPGLPKARNLEDYWYRQRGRLLTRVANQGFQEKLNGKKWTDILLPEEVSNGHKENFFSTISQAVARGFSKKEPNTYKGIWRHPAKGSGQICQVMEQYTVQHGGTIHFQAKVLDIKADKDRVTSLTAQVGPETITFEPRYLVSGAPPEALETFLYPDRAARPKGTPGVKRTVILAYLFLDENPRFPHFWLHVTDQNTKIGRIANYAATNSDMVPKGKTCICCEIYCFGDDPFLNKTDAEIAAIALEDCARSGLVDAGKCFDNLVLRFPGADASQNVNNWLTESRRKLFKDLEQFKNLFCVGRTDLDVSTLAGIEAGEAILSGNRGQFDERVDLRRLEDRGGGRKPFEFRNPPGVHG